MELFLYALAFFAVLSTFLSIAIPLTAGYEEPKGLSRPRNGLTRSPIGPLVLRLAEKNESGFLASHCQALAKKLLYAGKPWGLSAGEYLAASELSGTFVFALLAIMTTMASGGVTLLSALMSIAAALVCVWIFHLALENMANDRQLEMSRQFPFFLDLAVMTMESGSTFEETTEIYVRDNPNDALSQELRVLLGEMSMGKRTREALEELAKRLTAEEVQNTLRAIIQGLRMGTPLGEVLREQAEMMRFRRSQMAERAAEEIKVKVQPPMVVMMLSVFLLILGPAFVEVLQSDVY